MKTFTVSFLALSTSLGLVAARSSQKSRRIACPNGIDITLIGAETNNPNDQYTAPVDFGESYYPGSDPHIDYQISQLSISCVIYDHNVASCTFIGKDSPASGPIEKVDNEWNGQLGPPQTITEINCICIAQSSYKARDVTPALRPGALTPALQSRQLGSTTCEGSINIDVTLTAPDGCYTLTVPISTYGTQSNPVVPSDQVFDPQTATLSISQVDYAWNVATCFFTGRDSPNSGPVEGDYGVDGPHGLGPPQTITEVVCVCNTQY